VTAKKRNSNLELLRVLAILSVIALHAFRHAAQGRIFDANLSLNYILAIFTSSWGCGGVDVFFIISAYFLLESRRVKLEKVIKVVLVTDLYLGGTYLFSVLMQWQPFSARVLLQGLLSLVLNNYWFVTSYLFLYLVHPVLNQVIGKLNDKQLGKVSLILGLLLFVYKFLYQAAPVDSIGIGVAIYFCVAYYKRIGETLRRTKVLQYAGGMAAAAILGSEILYANPGTKSALTQYAAVQMTGKYSPFLLVLAFAIFDWYRRRAPFYSGLINTFSKGTLAIYVLHESYYIYPYLWDRVFPVGAWFQTPWFIVLYVGAILALFVGLSVLDLLLAPLYSVLGKGICQAYVSVFGELHNWVRIKTEG